MLKKLRELNTKLDILDVKSDAGAIYLWRSGRICY